MSARASHGNRTLATPNIRSLPSKAPGGRAGSEDAPGRGASAPEPRIRTVIEALAGGAIGAVITLTVALSVWLSNVPSDTEEHARLVADRDDDLGLWIADEQVRLGRRLD